jgi:hypothetical protein
VCSLASAAAKVAAASSSTKSWLSNTLSIYDLAVTHHRQFPTRHEQRTTPRQSGQHLLEST